jgi:alkanesulfonate monooxygenase SsuD/methylene tetrahydromethanopterin reductase-like flavin-dependent oxidoreductase (luciferase family)
MADAVNTYQEEPAESQEHIDAMLAKVEGSQQDPERPEWLPEKFNSVEDMAKAYSALESKLGQPQQEKQEAVSEEQVADATPSDIADALDANGLDFDVFLRCLCSTS